jgi:hypothetical protein
MHGHIICQRCEEPAIEGIHLDGRAQWLCAACLRGIEPTGKRYVCDDAPDRLTAMNRQVEANRR